MDEEEFLQDDLDVLSEKNIEKQPLNRQKPSVITPQSVDNFKFSDNKHIADIQQRLIRVEYELLFIRDKLFEKARNSKQEKLSPYGKLIKRRINE